jgi:UDP-3-O-[3-hydroxymyristoyl] glucosamine N-acyltransferase
MRKSLKDIALLIGGEVVGDESVEIRNVNGIREAQEGDITFLANPLYKPLISITKASAIITSRDINSAKKPIIRTEDPSAAFTKVISLFAGDRGKGSGACAGIHDSAIIGRDVKIGRDVYIAEFVVIKDASEISDGVALHPHVYIGDNTKIGKGSKIYPSVTIREGSVIGERVIIHSNSVIGSDGFGYVQVNKAHQKIPQTGIVVIEDDVEVGSNVSIDRARFGKTLIGKGTKIDNLVQIAHNVSVGANSIIVAQAGVSGSSRLGSNVVLAGQAGIVGHIELGDNVIVGAQAGVTKSVPANTVVLGSPANPITEQKKIFACIHKLPGLFKTVKELKDKILK